MVETTGLRFAPSLLSVMLSAFEGRAEGVNFEPRLIYIQVRRLRRELFLSCCRPFFARFLCAGSYACRTVGEKGRGSAVRGWCLLSGRRRRRQRRRVERRRERES